MRMGISSSKQPVMGAIPFQFMLVCAGSVKILMGALSKNLEEALDPDSGGDPTMGRMNAHEPVEALLAPGLRPRPESEAGDRLLGIGVFARRTRLSMKALRLYDRPQWIGEQGRTIGGSPREVYFADFMAAGPEDEVCDVAFPVR
jgi:hypothetical protein